MQNKAALIQEFNQARETVRGLLLELDKKMEIYPGWTIKEVLSHLTGWDDASIQAIRMFAADEPPLMTAARGIDYYNSQTVEERKELNYEQVVHEWEWVREELIATLENLSEKDLNTNIITPWGTSMSIWSLLEVMVEHEKEHAEIIHARILNPSEPPHAH